MSSTRAGESPLKDPRHSGPCQSAGLAHSPPRETIGASPSGAWSAVVRSGSRNTQSTSRAEPRLPWASWRSEAAR